MGLLAFLAIISWPWQKPGLPHGGTYRTVSAGVRLDVSVTRGSTPVRGLKEGDFVVYDNGVPQQVQVVETGNADLDVVLVLQPDGTLSQDMQSAALEGGQAVRALLRSGDRLGVLVAGAGPTVVRPLGAVDDAPLPTAHLGGLSVALRDSMVRALASFDQADRRRVLLVAADGRDTQSVIDSNALQAAVAGQPVEVVVLAVGASSVRRAVMFTDRDGTGVRESSTDLGGVRRAAPRWLVELAARSGGLSVDLAGDAGSRRRQRLLEVFDDLRSQYLLTYTPGGVAAMGWHDVTVRLRRGKATIRTRNGYWAGGSAAMSR